MGKIRFNLREPRAIINTPIYLIYQEKQEVLVYPTGLYVTPKNWDFKNYEFRGKSAISKKSNEYLKFYRLELQTILLNFKINKNRFTKDKAKAALNKAFNGTSIDEVTIYDFTKTIHDRLKGTVNKQGLPRILQHIKLFNCYSTFEEVDNAFYERFCDYLFGLGLVRITINKILTEFKRVWQMAVEEGITKNRNFGIVKKFKTQTDHIALELKDLKTIYDYQITEPILNFDIELVQEIKNRFLLSCFTGLRISDWNKIQKSNIEIIDNQAMFVIHTQKTSVVCAIPTNLFPFINKILNTYPGELPKLSKRNLGNVSKILKQLCKCAGLNQLTEQVVWKRQKTTLQKQLFERVTAHTARRTFVTVLLNKGYSENEIKKMTGHQSSASFNKYDKQKAVQNAVNISKKRNGKLKAI
jgi:site-specific recombinase XerD